MKSTKGLRPGMAVIVTAINEEEAVAYDAVVVDKAATGASANVASSAIAKKLMDEHGISYLEHANETSKRIKAGDLHLFTKEASAALADFRKTAADRDKLTSRLRSLAADISKLGDKAEAKKTEAKKK